MKFFVFLMLFFMSITTFAQGPSEPSEKQFTTSMRKEVKSLILDGKNEVKTVKDRELNRYFVALLKDKENTINGTLGLSHSYDGYETQTQRRDFYQNILKGTYRDIVTQIHARDSSRTIDSSKKQEIEGAFLSYQKDVIGNISDQLIKAINVDSLLKGNMSFSYESGSSYIRVRMQDYKIIQSLKRDEQSVNLTLKAAYNMDIPGEQHCDYNDAGSSICTAGSGTHISGYINAKIAFSQFGEDQYIQISDFDMKADVTGVEKTAIEKAIMAIRDYTHGKTYHIQNATGLSQQGDLAIIEKAGSLFGLLENTSIFTPVIRIGNEYVLNWNPSFVTKFNTITGNNKKPSGYMFPEFRYKDGVFFLNVASSDTSTMALQVAKNSEGKSLGTFDMHDADMKNSVTITLGKDLWKMNLNTPDLIINSDWNGSTTLTEISVSRLMKDSILFAIYSSFDNGLNRQELRDLMPDKFRIYGNLTSNAVSLKFDADASTFATIDSFTNGSNSNYRLYFNMFGQKIEFSGDLSQNYGTFSIERPQDAIDLDTKKHQKIQKSLGGLDGLMSR